MENFRDAFLHDCPPHPGDEQRAGWGGPGNPFNFPPLSPLAFDLDGDGLDIIRLADSRAYFDLDRDGFAERTAWIGADDGIQSIDLDADIINRTENGNLLSHESTFTTRNGEM